LILGCQEVNRRREKGGRESEVNRRREKGVQNIRGLNDLPSRVQL
jgi:hypothetical protein